MDDSLNESITSYCRVPVHWASAHISVIGYKVSANAGDVRWQVIVGDIAGSAILPTLYNVSASMATVATATLQQAQVATSVPLSGAGAPHFAVTLRRRGPDALDTVVGDWATVALLLTRAS